MPHTFSLRFSIAAPIERVFPFFANIEAFAEKHPIMYRVEQEADGRYRIYEKVRMLWIFPYSFSYLAWIESQTPLQEVVLAAIPRKGVEMRICFRFSADSTGQTTIIEEQVTVKAAWLPYRILRYFLTKSHRTLVQRIEQALF